MQGINFIAIDFEIATGKRASICEAGICVVRDGEIVETRSWLVRPQGNSYSYWNMQIHGIRPNDTANSRISGSMDRDSRIPQKHSCACRP